MRERKVEKGEEREKGSDVGKSFINRKNERFLSS